VNGPEKTERSSFDLVLSLTLSALEGLRDDSFTVGTVRHLRRTPERAGRCRADAPGMHPLIYGAPAGARVSFSAFRGLSPTANLQRRCRG
jgi:hypothetical protein